MPGTVNDSMEFNFGYEGYKITDQAQNSGDSNITYYGFLNRYGEWYLMSQTTSGTAVAYRYLRGSSDYTTNWAAREALTYDYFNTIFK